MNKTKNSTVIMKIVCAIIFIVFTYFYLHNYQADVLAMAQHVLSDGQTVYNRDVGAVLITLVLYLLQLAVFAITKMNRRCHALTYFPSLLVLTVLTDISPKIDEGFSFGNWTWVFFLILAFYVGVVWVVKQVQPYEPEIQNFNRFFSRMMWINMMEMIVMFLFVGLVSNHNDVFHYRMEMESLMNDGKYNKALKIGEKASDTDSSLTCLRVICLTKTKKLGERLFEYPLVGRAEAMNPNGTSVKVMMWKERHVTLYFKGKKRFYPVNRDVVLTSYLMDKKLDAFVAAFSKYYNIKSKRIPKHFKEALILYTHHRANPSLVYYNNVMDADFQDYQALERKFSNPQERQNALHDTYGNTYWYYWQYE